MRVIIDTGVLFRPALMRELRDGGHSGVLPAVALAERVRQLRREGRDVDRFLVELEATMTRIEPFGVHETLRTAPLDDATWKRHARDAMIAAHVREGDVLWTTNPRDFLALGFAPEQVRGV